jgi:hypothetical protein
VPDALVKVAQTADAGIHAFIVGVSDYVNLPDADDIAREETWFLNKLTTGAISAHALYGWLLRTQLRLPLKSVRLLLSPSTKELEADAAMAALDVPRADHATFAKTAVQWRRDAEANPDDMTLFYFAGHGMQRGPEEGVLLLDDFLADGSPALSSCAEIGNLRSGMAPSPTHPNIALTQFYFVDSCLSRPETLKKFVNPQVPPVFDVELNVVDRRQAPVMFSTVDGALAVGRDGKPTFFMEALLRAFERGAEEPEDRNGQVVWPITVLTIYNSVDLHYAKNKLGLVKLSSIVGSPVLRYLPAPPAVDVDIHVEPAAWEDSCLAQICDENDQSCCGDRKLHERAQFGVTLRAGMYRVQVASVRLRSSPYRSQLKWITQRFKSPWLHSLGAMIT